MKLKTKKIHRHLQDLPHLSRIWSAV